MVSFLPKDQVSTKTGQLQSGNFNCRCQVLLIVADRIRFSIEKGLLTANLSLGLHFLKIIQYHKALFFERGVSNASKHNQRRTGSNLFVDDRFIEQMSGLTRRFHEPLKCAQNPVIRADRPRLAAFEVAPTPVATSRCARMPPVVMRDAKLYALQFAE